MPEFVGVRRTPFRNSIFLFMISVTYMVTYIYTDIKKSSIPDILGFYVKSGWTFISQEQIPDVIQMHACELKGQNTAPSKTQSYPYILSHHLSSWLSSCMELWLLHPCWTFSPLTGHKDGTGHWASSHYWWEAHMSQLSEGCSSALTPAAVRWLLHGRTGRVTWASQV